MRWWIYMERDREVIGPFRDEVSATAYRDREAPGGVVFESIERSVDRPEVWP